MIWVSRVQSVLTPTGRRGVYGPGRLLAAEGLPATFVSMIWSVANSTTRRRHLAARSNARRSNCHPDSMFPVARSLGRCRFARSICLPRNILRRDVPDSLGVSCHG